MQDQQISGFVGPNELVVASLLALSQIVLHNNSQQQKA